MERGEAQLQTNNNVAREKCPFCIKFARHSAASTPQLEYLLLEQHHIRWWLGELRGAQVRFELMRGGSLEMSSHPGTDWRRCREGPSDGLATMSNFRRCR